MVTKKCGMQVVVYRIVGRPSTVILAKNSHTFREELCKKAHRNVRCAESIIPDK